MASAGRCSELHALVFDMLYIHFRSNEAGVTLHFTPEFVRKSTGLTRSMTRGTFQQNHRPNQVNDPWYIPAAMTGKPVCCSNCPSEGAQVLS